MNNSGVGKGNMTPTQVAFLVDRYLCDNNFSGTRTVFRNEASSLISRTPVNEAPKSLLSLGEILEEYISLKGQKVMLDQERVLLEHENSRVCNLLHGMQEVMNVYNGSSIPSVAPIIQASATKQVTVFSRAPANLVPIPRAANSKLSAPVTNLSLTRKRPGANSNGVVQQEQAPRALKKFKLLSKATPSPACDQTTSNASTGKEAAHGSTNGSCIAKGLFNQHQMSSSPRIECPGPETPPQQSISSPNDMSESTVAVSPPVANCSISPQDVTPTSCTVITSERVMVSPCKHVSYTVERNRFVSSPSPMKPGSKMSVTRDCVKARLDFGGSDETVCVDNYDLGFYDNVSAPDTDKDDDIFGMNLPAMFGPDFSFAELLKELELGLEDLPVLGNQLHQHSSL